MNKLGGMKVVKSIDNLIENEVFMNFLEDSTSDGRIKIWLHMFKGDVDVRVWFWEVEGVEGHYIGVMELLKIFDLTISSLSILSIFEGIIYFF